MKKRKNFDNIELAKPIISKGVPHVQYYDPSGVFGPAFSSTICKAVGNCMSVNAMLQGPNKDAWIKQMEW
jgi:hypothetical protein